MKSVVLDASSAILLCKAGRLESFLARYRALLPAAVLAELTVPGHPGGARFAALARAGGVRVLPPCGTDAAGAAAADLDRLGPGERDCIRAYLGGQGDFLLMDDGRGAGFCRRAGIPYVNALLVPRLLDPRLPAPGPVQADMRRIFALGRYAAWVLQKAARLTPAELTPFLP